ncbi:immunoglobulin superfamily member 1-like isoform X2 [Pelodiscus sinensis]|uniref:immunoglobulin superfamily member 1-like isoform X2 n=1 Tax=Pelodiscus sinensis TaxID=13735 RepID=UPI003F6B0CE0
MEPTHLLPLLELSPPPSSSPPASLQMLPRPVFPAGRLSVPKLTVSPPHRVFLRGESMTLTCSAPRTAKASGIRFLRDSQLINSGELKWTDNNARSLQLLRVSQSQAGTYSCEYWTRGFWQESSSERSQPISIAVTARPPPPSLSLDPPHPIYIRGEQVTLRCSGQLNEEAAGYRLFNQRGEKISSGVSSQGTWQINMSDAATSQAYSCLYWRVERGREIPSEKSPPVPVLVTAHAPPPRLSLDPPHPIYIRGEQVTLRCSGQLNEKAAGYRFFNQSGEQISSGESSQGTWQINTSDAAASQAYTCLYWRVERGREIPSEKSPPVPVSVTDPPSQPELSVDPPSGAVSKGFPLNITCTAPGDARERRFHFYKDGIELIPGDLGFEISTVEPGTGSVNVSLLSIPRASPNITGDYTCGHEENVNGRWIPSPRSSAVNVTGNAMMSGSLSARDILLGTGGVLLLIAALAALLFYCCRKKRVPKTPKCTEGSELAQYTRNLDPGHDSKGSKAAGAGAEQMEQDSEVTYALLVLPTSQAHTTQSKNKAKPAEDEHVLYSEVVTSRIRRKAK